MTFTLFAIIPAILGLSTTLMLLWAVRRAPVGYQDENGFHYGAEGSDESIEMPARRGFTTGIPAAGEAWTAGHATPVGAR